MAQVPAKHPQEIEVWYILPAVRREIVIVLKKDGLSQKKIAEWLNVSAPAISQYIKDKRAKGVTFPSDVQSFIEAAAKRIKDKTTAYQEIQAIVAFIKETKALCRIHEHFDSELEGCDICYK